MRFHPEKHTKSYTYTKAGPHYNTLCSIPPPPRPPPPPNLKIMKTIEEYETTERGGGGGGERKKRKRLLIPITSLLKLLCTNEEGRHYGRRDG